METLIFLAAVALGILIARVFRGTLVIPLLITTAAAQGYIRVHNNGAEQSFGVFHPSNSTYSQERAIGAGGEYDFYDWLDSGTVAYAAACPAGPRSSTGFGPHYFATCGEGWTDYSGTTYATTMLATNLTGYGFQLVYAWLDDEGSVIATATNYYAPGDIISLDYTGTNKPTLDLSRRIYGGDGSDLWSFGTYGPDEMTWSTNSPTTTTNFTPNIVWPKPGSSISLPAPLLSSNITWSAGASTNAAQATIESAGVLSQIIRDGNQAGAGQSEKLSAILERIRTNTLPDYPSNSTVSDLTSSASSTAATLSNSVNSGYWATNNPLSGTHTPTGEGTFWTVSLPGTTNTIDCSPNKPEALAWWSTYKQFAIWAIVIIWFATISPIAWTEVQDILNVPPPGSASSIPLFSTATAYSMGLAATLLVAATLALFGVTVADALEDMSATAILTTHPMDLAQTQANTAGIGTYVEAIWETANNIFPLDFLLDAIFRWLAARFIIFISGLFARSFAKLMVGCAIFGLTATSDAQAIREIEIHHGFVARQTNGLPDEAASGLVIGRRLIMGTESWTLPMGFHGTIRLFEGTSNYYMHTTGNPNSNDIVFNWTIQPTLITKNISTSTNLFYTMDGTPPKESYVFPGLALGLGLALPIVIATRIGKLITRTHVGS